LLSQLMVLFGFFALVLVSILWINKAVRMFDKLIGDGQPAWVFLEFTALTLPAVIGGMLPIAAFAAAVYVVYRLSSDNELTVIQATGYSPFRLGRAVLVFGVIVALMMSLLAHMLIPGSLGQLRQRESEISANVAAQLLSEGEFLHPAPGVTFYIREITPEGELRDVFLSDRRNPDRTVSYTSSRAYLVADGAGSRLVMVDGMAQNVRTSDTRLFVTHFDDFSYDITSLLSRGGINLNQVAFTGTAELLRDPEGVAERSGASIGEVMVELHGRFAAVLMCVVAALVGFSTLMVGSYSRLGVWRQVLAAFALLVGVEVARSASLGPVLANAALWPLLYLPVLAGIVLSLGLLWLAHHPAVWAWIASGFRRRPMEAAA
jgi:lipopolysaccharide export system permease protein